MLTPYGAMERRVSSAIGHILYDITSASVDLLVLRNLSKLYYSTSFIELSKSSKFRIPVNHTLFKRVALSYIWPPLLRHSQGLGIHSQVFTFTRIDSTWITLGYIHFTQQRFLRAALGVCTYERIYKMGLSTSNSFSSPRY